jgi:hypothetical protein
MYLPLQKEGQSPGPVAMFFTTRRVTDFLPASIALTISVENNIGFSLIS